MVTSEEYDALEEALIQAAYCRISIEKSLTVQMVGPWGSSRARVPQHWRAESTLRAQPYINALREVLSDDEYERQWEEHIATNHMQVPDDDHIEQACEVMHDAYEKAAVGTGWETNLASRKPWAMVPESNKATMRASVSALLEWLGHDDEQ